mmetsp:Transcript_27046/g.57973  ORF Transcript_27046/g.57973 Transcript_27046/m.57973 type:complete len:292 (-) Transcript_27046:64-939(-)|eukprot:CAMPEP_0172300274 /NCGR_PEP_ID=MMETSP1058-20130122/2395_1 /TAXON_ID=83371 /ORGANISM="Detonula confervacea, Strain CCMP 353" /LENGTH=291 /DNA_ID=CAMNT_0013010005 /DNA_START=171 /DNA_END=1046 /DNA_ORIENTATION=-
MVTTAQADEEPTLTIPASGLSIPQLAFGLYKVPADEIGSSIILEAIKAGYRHFDTASYYGNEHTLGKALKQSGIPRDQFFIVSKVWNDAQKNKTVRSSVLQSIEALDFGGYIDLFLIHWPVPGCFVDTYKEMEVLHNEGKLRHLGLSNFSIAEYEELMSKENNISVPPAVNQFEVSPFMYRPRDVFYFQERGVLVSSSKSLHRAGECFDNQSLKEISQNHSVSSAQIMLRWGIQKGLIVVSKTATPKRMVENRALFDFVLSEEEMIILDGLTTAEGVAEREKLEKERKLQM